MAGYRLVLDLRKAQQLGLFGSSARPMNHRGAQQSMFTANPPRQATKWIQVPAYLGPHGIVQAHMRRVVEASPDHTFEPVQRPAAESAPADAAPAPAETTLGERFRDASFRLGTRKNPTVWLDDVPMGQVFPPGTQLVDPTTGTIRTIKRVDPTGWFATDDGPLNPRAQANAHLVIRPKGAKQPEPAQPPGAQVAPILSDRDRRINEKIQAEYARTGLPAPQANEADWIKASILVDKEDEAAAAASAPLNTETLRAALAAGAAKRKALEKRADEAVDAHYAAHPNDHTGAAAAADAVMAAEKPIREAQEAIHGAFTMLTHLRGDLVNRGKVDAAVAILMADAPTKAPTAAHVTETRVWNGESSGMSVGDVRKIKGHDGYRVVVSAGKAKTRRLSEDDEDQGNGFEGQIRTTQQVTHRAATPEETAAEEARVAAVEEAKKNADPGHQREIWKAAHPAATPLQELGAQHKAVKAAIPESAWTTRATDGRQTWQTGTMPDGTEVARLITTGGDDYRETIYASADGSLAAADEAAKRAKAFQFYANEGGHKGVPRAHGYGAPVPEPTTPEEHAQVADGDRVSHLRTAAMAATERAHAAYTAASAPTSDPNARTDLSAEDVAAIHAWRDHREALRARGVSYAHRYEPPHSGGSPFDSSHRKVVDVPSGAIDFGPEAAMAAYEPAPYTNVPMRRPPRDEAAQWDELDSIRDRAPHLAERVAAARNKLMQTSGRGITSGADRQKLARKVAEATTVHPYDREMFLRHVTPADVEKLPKKVQAALAAHGIQAPPAPRPEDPKPSTPEPKAAASTSRDAVHHTDAQFSRLPNDTWGAKIRNATTKPEPGDRVTITKRDQSKKHVTVKRWIRQDGDHHIVSFEE